MILHIPHASLNLAGRSFECDTALELERMTDHRTDELFEQLAAVRVVFSVSRLVCDVERFTDETQESMAAKGMGICYQTNSFGKLLRHVSAAERHHIIEEFYKPHHLKLEQAVNAELAKTGQALIIDCHSFSNTPLPHEDSQHIPRPDICIGTEHLHTPDHLTELAVNHFRALGYSVAVNDPFGGSLVPLVHLHKNAQVRSLMIEVNRSTYQDNFEQVKYDVTRCLDALAGIG